MNPCQLAATVVLASCCPPRCVDREPAASTSIAKTLNPVQTASFFVNACLSTLIGRPLLLRRYPREFRMKKGKEKRGKGEEGEERARQEVLLEQRLYSGGAKQGLVSSLDRNFRRPSTMATRKGKELLSPRHVLRHLFGVTVRVLVTRSGLRYLTTDGQLVTSCPDVRTSNELVDFNNHLRTDFRSGEAQLTPQRYRRSSVVVKRRRRWWRRREKK